MKEGLGGDCGCECVRGRCVFFFFWGFLVGSVGWTVCCGKGERADLVVLGGF